jgi:lactoylglutathione lyase
MSFTRTGIILYVNKYDECVSFYRHIINLSIIFDTPDLTCFAFGDSYLMVERGEGAYGLTGSSHHSFCLRMNVEDVKARAESLAEKGIEVDYQEHDWGTVAKFFDPDGNLLAYKDNEKFEQQVRS